MSTSITACTDASVLERGVRMKLFSDVKYEVVGFKRVMDGYYWVLRERSVQCITNSAYIIVKQFKYVNDGKVYFFFEDGRVECNHKIIQESQLAYVTA